MPPPPSPPERVFEGQTTDQALADFDRAYENVEHAIENEQDPKKAFDAAGELAKRVDTMRTRTGTLRARCAALLAQTRNLSLMGLANLTGVSKRRAQEWLERAREEERR